MQVHKKASIGHEALEALGMVRYARKALAHMCRDKRRFRRRGAHKALNAIDSAVKAIAKIGEGNLLVGLRRCITSGRATLQEAIRQHEEIRRGRKSRRRIRKLASRIRFRLRTARTVLLKIRTKACKNYRPQPRTPRRLPKLLMGMIMML
jgi:hypothetical protein